MHIFFAKKLMHIFSQRNSIQIKMSFIQIFIVILFALILFSSSSNSTPRMTSTRNWPQPLNDEPEYEIISPNAEWFCNFEKSDCNVINDPIISGSYFEYRNTRNRQVFGKNNMLLLNVSNSRSSGARLITPYFKTKRNLKGKCSYYQFIKVTNKRIDN